LLHFNQINSWFNFSPISRLVVLFANQQLVHFSPISRLVSLLSNQQLVPILTNQSSGFTFIKSAAGSASHESAVWLYCWQISSWFHFSPISRLVALIANQ